MKTVLTICLAVAVIGCERPRPDDATDPAPTGGQQNPAAEPTPIPGTPRRQNVQFGPFQLAGERWRAEGAQDSPVGKIHAITDSTTRRQIRLVSVKRADKERGYEALTAEAKPPAYRTWQAPPGGSPEEVWLHRGLDITTGGFESTLLTDLVGSDGDVVVLATFERSGSPAGSVDELRQLRTDLAKTLQTAKDGHAVGDVVGPGGVAPPIKPASPSGPALELGGVKLSGERWSLQGTDIVTGGRRYAVKDGRTGRLTLITVVDKAGRLSAYTLLPKDIGATGAKAFNPGGVDTSFWYELRDGDGIQVFHLIDLYFEKDRESPCVVALITATSLKNREEAIAEVTAMQETLQKALVVPARGGRSDENVQKVGPKGDSRTDPITEDQAVAFVEKLKGTVIRDEKRLDRPVVMVELHGTEVTDAALKQLAVLKQLTTLNLYDTEVTDAGVKELAPLKNLTDLDLGRTKVTDVGVKELTALKNLADLGLGYTKVTDAAVKELAVLKKLNSLDLRFTEVTGMGLKELAGHNNLTRLNLFRTKVSDVGVGEVAALEKLNFLVLYGTNVTDAGVKQLSVLKELAFLDLGCTQVTDAGVKDLAGHKKLTWLSLGDTKVTDAGLQGMGALKNLSTLRLNDTKVGDRELTELAALKNLTDLDLGSTKVTDVGLKQLAVHSGLTRLSLGNTKVTDEGLKELVTLKNLASLNLSFTEVTDEGVKELQKALPQCRVSK